MKIQNIKIKKFGKAETLKVTESELDESLEKDEILVKTHFSGINFADIVMRIGMYQDAPPKPFVPGYEISGEIIKIGSAVKDFNIGDKVLAGTRFGGYSSHVKVKPFQIAKLPDFLDLAKGAALPVAFMTAHIALNEIGRIRKGDKVLIDCATGGVGTIALQILRAIDAQAYGLTRSQHKKDIIESYGAKALTFEEFEKDSTINNLKFVLNSTASPKQIKLQRERLRLSGQVLFIGFQSAIVDGKRSWPLLIKNFFTLPRFSPITLMINNQTLSGLNVLNFFDDREYVQESLKSLVNSDYLDPLIGKVYPAHEISKAHRDLETGRAKGKLIIQWT